MRTLFQNGRILTMDDACPVLTGDLLVEDGIIAAVSREPITPQPGDTVISAEGKILMPGFVNAHTHAPMTLLRGVGDDLPLERWLNEAIFPLEDHMGDEDFYWGSEVAIAEMLSSGTVLFSEMYMGAGEIARAACESGIRGLIARGMACFTEDPAGMEERLHQAYDFAEGWEENSHGRIRYAVAPHAEYTCTPAFLERCGRFAADRGWLFHTHASESEKEHRECIGRHGKTPIGLLNGLGCLDGKTVLAHCVHADEEDLAILARRGTSVVYCPESNLKLGSGIAPVNRMRELGINVAMGTDGASSNNDLDLLSETRVGAYLMKGVSHNAAAITAYEALKMATVGGRKALGFEGGTLKKGACGDLIMLDANGIHLTPFGDDPYAAVLYSARTSDVCLTMVDGRILYRDGVYTTLDIERIVFEAKRARARLMEKAKA